MRVSRVDLESKLEAADRALVKHTPLVLRITAGLLWLSNVSWKVPPNFGRSGGECRQLCHFVQAGIEDPVAPGYPWILDNLVSPNLGLFGWFVLIVEVLLAAMLLSGTLTRVAAAAGFVQGIFIGLSVANAPNEWYWAYVLMAALHLAVYASAAAATPAAAASPRRTRGLVVASTAAYGVLMAVASVRNGVFTNSPARRDELLVFGGDSGFPDEFGREVFAGSVGLGLVFSAVAVLVATVRGRQRRWMGLGLAGAAVVLLAGFRDSGSLLGAKPAAAAVLLAVAFYLLTPSRPSVQASTSRGE